MATSGEVISFYSYKGGVGRTMALANVACVLAERERQEVLVIDWDLEAPGLYRFFESIPGQLRQWRGDDDTSDRPGLIDLFELLLVRVTDERLSSEEDARELLESVPLDDYLVSTGVPNVSLLGAGRQGADYGQRVNTFPWIRLYEQIPSVFTVLAEVLSQRFRYVLVDTRTGLTDTAGICTMLLPEKLVIVFTPTRQGLTGVTDLIARATAYRRESSDLRPLVAYPLASRIDASEEDLRREWRFGDGAVVAVGYQRQFERVLQQAYDLPVCDLTEYFDEVAIQHVPSYAYGEQVAVLAEPTGDRLSLARSYRRFTSILTSSSPWEVGAAAAGSLARFVNRHAEQQAFLRILHEPAPPVLFVTGEVGMGKTALLHQYAHLCRKDSVPVALVDLATVLSPAALADEVARQLGTQGLHLAAHETRQADRTARRGPSGGPAGVRATARLPGVETEMLEAVSAPLDELLDDLAGLGTEPRPVVLLDNVERAYPEARYWLDTRIATGFVGSRARGILLVLAGRSANDLPGVTDDPSTVTQLLLGAFTTDDIVELLALHLPDRAPNELQTVVDLVRRGTPISQILAVAEALGRSSS